MSLGLLFSAHTAISLFPVVLFLAFLIYCDSFKLVPFRLILTLIGVGAMVTVAGYVSNNFAYLHFPGDFTAFSRYGSPFVEEALKAAPLVFLVRTRRVGILVDAAIAGFCVGTGFAVVENLYYLAARGEASIVIQLVRGFGTAIMHATATATFALVAISMRERRPANGSAAFALAYMSAVGLHSGFNHLLVYPMSATLMITVALPVVFVFIFHYSERSVRDWMEAGLDSKMQLLKSISSGVVLQTPAGQYLQSLRERFNGETLADMLCYLGLHGELVLRAQGTLILRETGWKVPDLDEETRERLAELKHLELLIGRTGMLVLHPLVGSNSKKLLQLAGLVR